MTQKFVDASTSASRLITEPELAQELGLHPNTPAMWRREDIRPRPRHLQIGRAIRYRREDVDAYLAGCAATPEHKQPSAVIEADWIHA